MIWSSRCSAPRKRRSAHLAQHRRGWIGIVGVGGRFSKSRRVFLDRPRRVRRRWHIAVRVLLEGPIWASSSTTSCIVYHAAVSELSVRALMFTDIEGSTGLVRGLGERYGRGPRAPRRHHQGGRHQQVRRGTEQGRRRNVLDVSIAYGGDRGCTRCAAADRARGLAVRRSRPCSHGFACR